MMKGPGKTILIYIIIAVALVLSAGYIRNTSLNEKITYTQFQDLLQKQEISSVTISTDNLMITPKDTSEYKGKTLTTVNIPNQNLLPELEKANVNVNGEVSTYSPLMSTIVSYAIMAIVLVLMWKFVFSKMGSKMGGGMMPFGKNNAKVYMEDEIGVTFNDVAGQEEAKESLVEVIDYLNDPKKYTEIGAKLPKGALLVGPPGTGKTLLAKAVAGEAKVPFFSISGSSFVEMFVGAGAKRVRELFKDAAEKAPCIIFIDEIDAVGKSRDSQLQSNDEREQTLNQLLAEMDGFDSTKAIVILAATNRPEILDKALLRPGRFDRRIIVDRPDFPGREAILKVHAKDVKLGPDVDLVDIAKSTPGAVGADLANIMNEGALRAVREGRKEVSQDDLREAVEDIIAGKEKKDRILSKQERDAVAFHEVGHALVAALLEDSDPVHKITIVPRTMGALGYTMQLPEDEKYLVSKEDLLNQITVMFGGRAAEEEVFNLVSTGASNDIERATQTARSMVTVYGMTDRFDMMALESVQNRYLDGRAVRNCSEQTSTLIDEEVLNIVRSCHGKARQILNSNRDLLDEIAGVLLEKETIFGDEFMDAVYRKYPEMKIKKEEKDKIREAAKKEVEEAKKKAEELRKAKLEEIAKKNEERARIEAEERKAKFAALDEALEEMQKDKQLHEGEVSGENNETEVKDLDLEKGKVTVNLDKLPKNDGEKSSTEEGKSSIEKTENSTEVEDNNENK
ncbi:ATP-dependent zinc metalloprotease FtsH [uncultured Clostridium sp.]|uniref:ATP-dependent zinc metalloprotease FtsH n=1 Tax=uncultured Clostridium sp. TaxID=59620 RepID=UPI0026022B35|nr:ATP-dependent zinc metalloprotease FtsH [uncultured Clostridium sp.]